MKSPALRRSVLPTLALAPLILLLAGCKSEPQNPPAAPPTSAPPSPSAAIEKTSFTQVTSKLDPGGTLYSYISTESWISTLSTNVSAIGQLFLGFPGIPPEIHGQIENGLKIGVRLIQKSGVQDISGIGRSGIAIEKGVYRSKSVVHHYEGKASGWLWNIFGAAPHPLDGLNQLPAKTALASFSDFELGSFWTELSREAAESGFPEVQMAFQSLPELLSSNMGLNLKELLDSTAGEFGCILTIDESRRFTVPTPSAPLSLPEIQLAILIKVKNDALFTAVDRLLQDNPMIQKQESQKIRMRTADIPLPIGIPLRPSIARSGDYLYLATSDALVQEIIAVRDGTLPGLKSTEEFKRLSKDIPAQGNSFCYLSPRLLATVSDIQGKFLSAMPGMAESGFLRSLAETTQETFLYQVSANDKDGWINVSNGTSDPARQAIFGSTLPVIAVGAILAGIAIPNFVKARSTAQQNTIINNLRILEGAKDQYALEFRKKDGDIVTMENLKPYLRGGTINQIVGETYNLNPIGTAPTATTPVRINNYSPGDTISLPR